MGGLPAKLEEAETFLLAGRRRVAWPSRTRLKSRDARVARCGKTSAQLIPPAEDSSSQPLFEAFYFDRLCCDRKAWFRRSRLKCRAADLIYQCQPPAPSGESAKNDERSQGKPSVVFFLCVTWWWHAHAEHAEKARKKRLRRRGCVHYVMILIVMPTGSGASISNFFLWTSSRCDRGRHRTWRRFLSAKVCELFQAFIFSDSGMVTTRLSLAITVTTVLLRVRD